ncbi:protein aurora borealis isoform X2 [Apodemus sylvaticus]|uniref:protein aurora borealis isoform X2 n=1 Tax=Apodemus sylvaticus TaxID=10129 RepID=UPI002242D9C5|nr:protein aurora borealis isoform X2 [Apodemus sylvaticus]
MVAGSEVSAVTRGSPLNFDLPKTPREFRWSIDQLAVINPVEIDPEEIHRQASYLSLSRIDKDVEDKRQKAIEEFFTKDVIVPSPWTDHDGKQPSELHPSKCLNSNSDSPVGKKPSLPSQKCNAACQTLLSLPVDFNLEAVLGDYFRVDEVADQSPGNLSSSSLRRKLFLDVNGSISDSLPSMSPRSPPSSARGSLEEQFSSSPIQNSAKKYSLGSITTSPSAISSPTFSPISLQVGKTPLSEHRKFTFHSPEASSGAASTGIANPSVRSPYIDGCSPIKNWSPRRLRGGPHCLSSLMPFTLEAHSEGEEEDVSSTDVAPLGTNAVAVPLQLNCGTLACVEPVAGTAMSVTQSQPGTGEKEGALLENAESEKENDTVDMVDPVDTVGESTWIKEPVENGHSSMADFVSGIAFSIENSHMCMSPLAESSVLPCESSTIQMDSGYNTHTCGSNITDIVGTESYCKENVTQSFEVEMKSQVNNIMPGHTVQRCWMNPPSPPQCSSP